MNVRKIHDFNGRPFADFHRAAWLRDILVEVTGRPWCIEAADEGFLVAGGSDSGKSPVMHQQQEYATFKSVVFRPALRTTLPFYLPLAMLGVYMAINPAAPLAYLAASPGFMHLLASVDAGQALRWSATTGKVIFLFSVLSALMPWLTSRYLVGPDGVESRRGLIARDIIQVRFSDIRSIGLRQTLIGRLLGVGTLEFSSSGTGGVDVRFVNIPAPMRVKKWIEQLMSFYGNPAA